MLCLENVCIKNILFYLDVDFASFKNRFQKVNWSIMCISLWLHIFGKVRFKVVGVVGTMVFSRTVQNEPHCAQKYCRRSPQEMLNLYPLQCRKRDSFWNDPKYWSCIDHVSLPGAQRLTPVRCFHHGLAHSKCDGRLVEALIRANRHPAKFGDLHLLHLQGN